MLTLKKKEKPRLCARRQEPEVRFFCFSLSEAEKHSLQGLEKRVGLGDKCQCSGAREREAASSKPLWNLCMAFAHTHSAGAHNGTEGKSHESEMMLFVGI